MKTFILGDVHGAAKAIDQCFERSGFNINEDRLIFLGDVADGWPHVRESIDLLLRVKNLVSILGNHDLWLLNYVMYGQSPNIWLTQGGYATLKSYNNTKIPDHHLKFLKSMIPFFKENNMVFVHGGLVGHAPIEEQYKDDLMWDRSLVNSALTSQASRQCPKNGYGGYADIFVGHTTTTSFSFTPIRCCNVWMLDQGAGYEGKLSIMDLETKQFWQSDKVDTLYPGEHGR